MSEPCGLEPTQILNSGQADPVVRPSSSGPAPGRLAHYRIESRLGQGGMGTVYRAWDTALERPVAIKLVHSHLLSDDRDFLGR